MLLGRLLWIDDEVDEDDPGVRLLRSEGIGVDCVQAGEMGVAQVLTTSYSGVILDLRLPGIDGLDVLRRLVEVPEAPPVTVLTGFGTVASSVAAMRIGALDVREKPIVGEELVAMARRVLAGRRRRSFAQAPAPAPVLSLRFLAYSIVSPTFSSLQFLRVTRAFRDLQGASNCGATRECDRASPDQLWALSGALETLSQRSETTDLMCVESFAELCHLNPTSLRPLLEREIGLSFLQCRLALRLRPALRLIAFTREQTAQIGYGLRYEHPSQFARDFQSVFRLTPTAYRRLCSSEK